MRTEQRLARIRSVLTKRQPDLTVVMENIHDPHNVSAMLRSCDAVGVFQVQLLYTQDEFPDIGNVGKKSSASAKKWVDRRRFSSPEECFSKLKQEGFKIFATRLDERAVSLYDMDLTRKVAFVFGNEHRGVSDEAAKFADENVQIPMVGMIQSLNVSVACAVTLFEAARQRLQTGGYGSSKFSNENFERLAKEWALKE
jgi:tRNA (guanosine-2'-O-)-methyltransferase